MCKYTISIDDAVMEKVRPTIAKGMDENTWVQIHVQMMFAKMAEVANAGDNSMKLSQRLRGIGHAPKGFDYKKELEERIRISQPW